MHRKSSRLRASDQDYDRLSSPYALISNAPPPSDVAPDFDYSSARLPALFSGENRLS